MNTRSNPLRALEITDWLLLVTLSLLWGGSYLFMTIAVASLPTLTIVFGRVSIACVALGSFLLLSGAGLPRGRQAWLAFFGMGALNNVIPMSLIVFATHSIGAGLASILNAMTPLFTIIVAHFVSDDEKITPNKLFGIGLGVVGVTILIGPDALTTLSGSVIAKFACLGAALSYALSNNFGRRFARLGIKPLSIAFGQVTASSAMLLPFSLMIDRPWTLPVPSTAPLLSVLGLGILCTALAYVIFFRVLNRSGALAVALVTLMIPPSAVVLGMLVLGETASLGSLVGMVLIGCGLVAVNRRKA
jgi:drug/metabolite transporter (DMT)-like permease